MAITLNPVPEVSESFKDSLRKISRKNNPDLEKKRARFDRAFKRAADNNSASKASGGQKQGAGASIKTAVVDPKRYNLNSGDEINDELIESLISQGFSDDEILSLINEVNIGKKITRFFDKADGTQRNRIVNKLDKKINKANRFKNAANRHSTSSLIHSVGMKRPDLEYGDRSYEENPKLNPAEYYKKFKKDLHKTAVKSAKEGRVHARTASRNEKRKRQITGKMYDEKGDNGQRWDKPVKHLGAKPKKSVYRNSPQNEEVDLTEERKVTDKIVTAFSGKK